MTHRIAQLAAVLVALASLTRSAWSGNVETAPKLGGLAASAIAAPAASLPRMGDSFGASSIKVPGAAAAISIKAVSAQAPAAALTAALPKGALRQSVAAFSAASADPKHADVTIGRAFTGGGSESGDVDEGDSGQMGQAVAALQEALDDINQQAAGIRVGHFGVQLRGDFVGDKLAIKAAFTYNGRPLRPEILAQALKTGQISPQEWQKAQQILPRIAKKLAQKFMESLHGESADPAVARAIGARAHAMEGAAFKSVAGPAAQESREAPHLTPRHFERFLNKLVDIDEAKSGSKGPSLREQDVERLAHVLTTMDRMNVDPIPTATWQSTLKDMAHAAQHAFHPEKYNWEKTVTLLLKMAARRLLDLHSAYFDAKENKSFEDRVQHQFAGIGLQYLVNDAGQVSFIYPGSPARKAGLQPGDKIVSIDDVPAAQIARFNEKLSGQAPLRLVVEREHGERVELTLPAGAGKDVRVVEASDFGRITLVAPNGPAAKAGIKVGDHVIAMNGIKLTREEPMAMYKRSQGEAGSTLKVLVERDGRLLPEMSVTRAEVDVPNVFSKIVAPGVGYVYLGIFSQDAGQEVVKAVAKLREQGARKLVLDLRANPGGDVNAVSTLLAAFAKDGKPLITFKRQGQIIFSNVSEGDGAYSDMPVVVLVNGYSASGSEATSGALQDLRGKVVVGTRTYGKGTGQTTETDAQGRGLHLTMGRWYTPADRSIDAQRDPKYKNRWVNLKGTGGVVPDHEVPLPKDHEFYLIDQLQAQLHGLALGRPEVEDPQLQKALEVLAGIK